MHFQLTWPSYPSLAEATKRTRLAIAHAVGTIDADGSGATGIHYLIPYLNI